MIKSGTGDCLAKPTAFSLKRQQSLDLIFDRSYALRSISKAAVDALSLRRELSSVIAHSVIRILKEIPCEHCDDVIRFTDYGGCGQSLNSRERCCRRWLAADFLTAKDRFCVGDLLFPHALDHAVAPIARAQSLFSQYRV